MLGREAQNKTGSEGSLSKNTIEFKITAMIYLTFPKGTAAVKTKFFPSLLNTECGLSFTTKMMSAENIENIREVKNFTIKAKDWFS